MEFKIAPLAIGVGFSGEMDVSGDARTDFGEDFRLVRKHMARVRSEDFLHKIKFNLHRRRT